MNRQRLLRMITLFGAVGAALFALKQVVFYLFIARLGGVDLSELALYRIYTVFSLAGLVFEGGCAAVGATRAAEKPAFVPIFVLGSGAFLYGAFAFVFRIYGGFFTLLLLPGAFSLITLAALFSDVAGTLAVAAGLVAGYFVLILGCEAAAWLPPQPFGFTLGGGLMLLLHAGLVAALARERVRGAVEISRLEATAERSRILEIFGQQVSPQVVEKLLGQKGLPPSETRSVCVMFLDVRGFTAFSEGRSPDEVVRYLNSLWSFMVDVVNAHHGIVNKFLGDGFMATFGAPLAEGNHCTNAIHAAQEIIARTERAVAANEIPPTRIGIGLHAGNVVTGNVGSAQRKEYTVIGDVVNLASRIEAMNKELGSSLLASRAVLDGAEAPLAATPLGAVKIRGHAEVELLRIA